MEKYKILQDLVKIKTIKDKGNKEIINYLNNSFNGSNNLEL